MDLVLKKVNSKSLFSIRSKILRNNSSYEFCKFEGDESLDSIHIGAYIKKLI